MQKWNIPPDGPFQLNIAALFGQGTQSYTDDQVWELNFGSGQPQALALQTNFGLRARNMVLFPQWTHRGEIIINPSQFHRLPVIEKFSPDRIQINFAPISGIETTAEYWVRSSNVVAGRFRFTNRGIFRENFRFEWMALLSPHGSGNGMSAQEIENSYILKGRTSNLFPVCILNSGPIPGSSPYPSLMVQVDLMQGASQTYTWACASGQTIEESFELARRAMSSTWDAQCASHDLAVDQDMVVIQTGDPALDAVLAFSQKAASSLVFPATASLPAPSFVLTRNPNDGYSFRGDGSDYPPSWCGQTSLDTYYFSKVIVPPRAGLICDFLANFVYTQSDDGTIDFQPGLGGQRTRLSAQPLIASTLAELIPHFDSPDHLSSFIRPLTDFIDTWQNTPLENDPIPVWKNPIQTGLEDHPLYDRFHIGGQGVNLEYFNSPALGAMLYAEITSLIKIKQRCGQIDGLPQLQQRAAVLRQAVISTWDERTGLFHYQDRATHRSAASVLEPLILTASGRFTIQLQPQQQRLSIHLTIKHPSNRAVSITLIGRNETGIIEEEITPEQWTWVSENAFATSQNVWNSVNRVIIDGLEEQGTCSIAPIDLHQDAIDSLLPLWAGIPTSTQAAQIVKTTLPFAVQTFGIPTLLTSHHPAAPDSLSSVSPLWNSMVISGLLRYGYEQEAADLLLRNMKGILACLRRTKSFRDGYHAETGRGTGNRNSLRGLAPVGLFLQVAGLRSFKPNRVILKGKSPFPFPITVQYQGMTITLDSHQGKIVFPNGQIAQVTGPELQHVTL